MPKAVILHDFKYAKTNTLGVENSPKTIPNRSIVQTEGKSGTVYLSHITKNDSGMQSLLENKIEFETQNSRVNVPSRSTKPSPNNHVGHYVAGLILQESKRLLQLD